MADSVLPIQGNKSVAHMNAIGYVIAGGIALVLLPVLPLLVVMYLLGLIGEEEQEVAYARTAE